jgi:hypothetical protein
MLGGERKRGMKLREEWKQERNGSKRGDYKKK